MRDGHSIKLSSGRIIEPNMGIIGIAPDSESVFYGYDGELHKAWQDDGEDDKLSPRELVELSDIMLARWLAFRERALHAAAGEAR